jgi:7-carboxy-7-deazaguanine synthase
MMANQSPVSHQLHAGMLPVMEAFYTIQGEGFYTGHAAYFVRLAGCDVGCVWCDVKESWDVSAEQWLPIGRIVDEALQFPSRMVVITGGEPCMYDLTELISLFHKAGFRVHIETSGAYQLKGNADWVCVSPKKFKFPLDDMLKRADELKVVVFNESDLDWAVSHAVKTSSGCRHYLQPEFGKSNKMLPVIVDFVRNHPSWQISLQTHKFLGIP